MDYRYLLKSIYDLLLPRERRRAHILVVQTFFMALLEMVSVASILPFLSVLANPNIIEEKFILLWLYDAFGHSSTDDVTSYLIMLGFLSFMFMTASIIFRSFTQWQVNDFIEMMRYSLSNRLLSKLIRKKYEFFFTIDNSDLSKTILSETDVLVQNVVKSVFNMFAYLMVLFFLVLLLVIYNPVVAIIALCVLLILYIIMFKSLSKFIKKSGENISTSNTDRFKSINEIFTNIKYIKMTGLEENFELNFAASAHKYAKSQSIYQTLVQVPSHFVELIALGSLIMLSIFLIVTTGGHNSEVLSIIVPTLGIYAFAAYRIKPAVHNVYAGMSSLRFGEKMLLSVLNRIHDESYDDAVTADPLSIASLAPTGGIRFEGVSYRYPRSTNFILSDITFNIGPGTIVGIEGSTGSGKSTLLDLLTGLIEPTQGKIFFAEQQITKRNVRDLRDKIAYVPQEVLLLNSSIAQNISFDERIDSKAMNKIVEVARLAEIHEFIKDGLDDGYLTEVGERGFKLSGGERQRISIARALYKESEIIILDEITSALDTETEKRLIQNLLNACKGKTIIMVAHRLSTLNFCDILFRVDNGHVVTVTRKSQDT